jgi:hypothetical protein
MRNKTEQLHFSQSQVIFYGRGGRERDVLQFKSYLPLAQFWLGKTKYFNRKKTCSNIPWKKGKSIFLPFFRIVFITLLHDPGPNILASLEFFEFKC